MAEECTVCNELIDPSTQAWSENSCEVHYAHTACVRKHETNFGCSACDPSAQKLDDDENPTLELVNDEEVPQLEPVPPKIALHSIGVFSSMRRLASKFIRDDVETSKDPFFLVKSHYPVEHFFSKKKLRLHHIVNDHGISIDDFMAGKYTFGELLGFSEINCDEGLDTLISMGLNHEKLYDYRRQFPFSELNQRYGLTAQGVIDKMNY